MFLFWLLFAAASGVRDPGPLDMTLDESIINAMIDSRSGDFIQNNDTLLVELDVLLTPEQWNEKQNPQQKSYSAVRHGLWPDATVPYEPIGNEFSTSDKRKIMDAMAEYEEYTCIKFRPAVHNDRHKIYYYSGGGCSSHVGTVGPRQGVSLANGCRYHGVIVHELGHAVGLHHEQTRPDRDNYVSIVKSNIDRKMLYNFDKYETDKIDTRGLPYDYRSIMHYGPTAFALDYSRPTIRTHNPVYQNVIGQRHGLSFDDVRVLNAMYNCGGRCNKYCPKDAYVGKDCQCYCEQERKGKKGKPAVRCDGNAGGGSTGGESTGGGSTGGGSTGGGTGEGSTGTGGGWTTVGTGGGGLACKDLESYCSTWAESGSCTDARYKTYMEIYCRQSCRLCGRSAGCIDKDGRCGEWARLGVCNHCQQIKEDICPVSCAASKCSDKPTADAECHDNHYDCADWAESGLCGQAKYQAQLRRLCPKSCQICGSNMLADPNMNCIDVARSCARFARQGGCETNPHWMNQFCKKSCKLCGPRSYRKQYRQCKDVNAACEIWASREMCGQNRAYMNDNCPKSCGFC